MKGSKNVRGLLLLVACLTLAAPLAIAQSEDPAPQEEVERVNLGKLIDYGMCAVSIIGASTGVGVAVAVLTCGRAFYIWWVD